MKNVFLAALIIIALIVSVSITAHRTLIQQDFETFEPEESELVDEELPLEKSELVPIEPAE